MAFCIFTGIIFVYSVYSFPSPDDLMNRWCGDESCYDVLGVNKSSSKSEISKIYKQLAIKYHPDKNRAKRKEAEKIFQRITYANAVLMDDEKRKRYDEVTNLKAKLFTPRENPFFVISLMFFLGALLKYYYCRYLHNNKKRRLFENEAVRRRLKKKLLQEGKKPRIRNNAIDEDIPDELLFETVKELGLKVPGGLNPPPSFLQVLKSLPLAPIKLGHDTLFYTRWAIQYGVLKQKYSVKDKVYLTVRALGITQKDWNSFSEDEREKYLKKEQIFTSQIRRKTSRVFHQTLEAPSRSSFFEQVSLQTIRMNICKFLRISTQKYIRHQNLSPETIKDSIEGLPDDKINHFASLLNFRFFEIFNSDVFGIMVIEEGIKRVPPLHCRLLAEYVFKDLLCHKISEGQITILKAFLKKNPDLIKMVTQSIDRFIDDKNGHPFIEFLAAINHNDQAMWMKFFKNTEKLTTGKNLWKNIIYLAPSSTIEQLFSSKTIEEVFTRKNCLPFLSSLLDSLNKRQTDLLFEMCKPIIVEKCLGDVDLGWTSFFGDMIRRLNPKQISELNDIFLSNFPILSMSKGGTQLAIMLMKSSKALDRQKYLMGLLKNIKKAFSSKESCELLEALIMSFNESSQKQIVQEISRLYPKYKKNEHYINLLDEMERKNAEMTLDSLRSVVIENLVEELKDANSKRRAIKVIEKNPEHWREKTLTKVIENYQELVKINGIDKMINTVIDEVGMKAILKITDDRELMKKMYRNGGIKIVTMILQRLEPEEANGIFYSIKDN